MRTLTLHVKSEYFDQIRSGEKTEEFRVANHFWKMRLTEPMVDYDKVVICKGYPSRHDLARRIERPWSGCVLKTIVHKHFGPDPVEVFAIRVNP
jgi:hypothetical protein